jgi:hypothetical protein
MSETATSLRPPLITGDKSLADVTRDICAPMDCKPTGLWWVAFIVSVLALVLGVVTVWYQIATGIGTWGLNKTVGWAFDITNFVFWVGIGHAGTLISAVLFLFRQKWRTAVNRSAEAMTLFAVMCAGIFPLIHMGRPWLAFWMIPLSEYAWAAVGQFQIAVALGRLRDFNLFADFRRVLVCRTDSRSWPPFAIDQSLDSDSESRRCFRWAGTDRREHGTAMKRSTCCWRVWQHRWSFQSTPSSVWTLPPP